MIPRTKHLQTCLRSAYIQSIGSVSYLPLRHIPDIGLCRLSVQLVSSQQYLNCTSDYEVFEPSFAGSNDPLKVDAISVSLPTGDTSPTAQSLHMDMRHYIQKLELHSGEHTGTNARFLRTTTRAVLPMHRQI